MNNKKIAIVIVISIFLLSIFFVGTTSAYAYKNDSRLCNIADYKGVDIQLINDYGNKFNVNEINYTIPVVSINPKSVNISTPQNITFYANLSQPYINPYDIYNWYVNNNLTESSPSNQFIYNFHEIGVYNIAIYVKNQNSIIAYNTSIVIFYGASTTPTGNSYIPLLKYVIVGIAIVAISIEIIYILIKRGKHYR
jgi:hypothetical protein